MGDQKKKKSKGALQQMLEEGFDPKEEAKKRPPMHKRDPSEIPGVLGRLILEMESDDKTEEDPEESD